MTAHINSDFLTHGIEPLSPYAGQLETLSAYQPEDWANKPLKTRFSAIDHILQHSGKRSTSITETDILIRVSGTIRASQRYQNMIITAAENSADALTQSAKDAAIWLNLLNESEETQQSMLIRLHHTMMYHAKRAFGENTPLGQMLEPAKMNFYKKLDDQAGYVELNSQTGENEIFINLHPNIIKNHQFDLVDTVPHETSHIIDRIVADVYDADHEAIPDWLQNDAQRLSLTRKFNAYIPSNSMAAYRFQSEEDQAFAVGGASMRRFSRNVEVYCSI